MAVQTDTNIVSIDALISAFFTFAVANSGFTDEGTVPITLDTISQTLRRISRITNAVTTYWGFVERPMTSTFADTIKIESRMMRVLPTAANWTTLADGQRIRTQLGLYNFAAPYTGYKFYSDGNNVFAAVEVRVGIYTHFGIGNIDKCGTYDGGEFLQGDFHEFSAGFFQPIQISTTITHFLFAPQTNDSSTSGNYIRFNAGGNDELDFYKLGREDNSSNVSGSATISPPSTTGSTGTGSVTSTTARFDPFGRVIDNSPSTATLVAPIMPCYITRVDSTLVKQRIIGQVPNIGGISIGNLNAKDIVNTDWDVYPRCQKTGDNTVATISDDWGIAYKAIP